MPNWCDTTYICVGDPKEIRQLNNAIKTNNKRKTSRIKNGFGTLWIGNIIDQLGGNWKDWKCRGEIIDFDMEKGAKKLTIYQSTAWCEQEGFRKFIEQKFPSIKVYYQDIEVGCEWYVTNDCSGQYFPGRYYLEFFDDSHMFRTIEETANYVSNLVGKTINPNLNDLQIALDGYEEKLDDDERDVYFVLAKINVTED